MGYRYEPLAKIASYIPHSILFTLNMRGPKHLHSFQVYNPRFHAYVDTSDDHIFSHGDRIRLVGDDSTGYEGNLPLKRR